MYLCGNQYLRSCITVLHMGHPKHSKMLLFFRFFFILLGIHTLMVVTWYRQKVTAVGDRMSIVLFNRLLTLHSSAVYFRWAMSCSTTFNLKHISHDVLCLEVMSGKIKPEWKLPTTSYSICYMCYMLYVLNMLSVLFVYRCCPCYVVWENVHLAAFLWAQLCLPSRVSLCLNKIC